MTNKTLSHIIASIICAISYLVSPTIVLAAPKLYLDQTNITVKQNGEFTLPLKIDAESNEVLGSDITLNYAGSDQEVIGVDNAGYFPEFTWANNATGKLEIHAFTSSVYQGKSGTGTIANIKFKAIRDSGSSTVTFGCDGSSNDTNILNSSGTDILACSSLNQTLVTYEKSGVVTSPSPSPTTMSSSIAPQCTSLTIDPSDSTKIPQTVAINCLGNDQDNDITSVELVYGDGTSQKITINPGQSISLNTTHTYTKSGTFNLTCKLYDGVNYSGNCTKTLAIKLAATPKPSIKPSVKPLNNNKSTPKPSPIMLLSESPSPSPSFTPTPSSIPSTTQDDAPQNYFWWIIPILAVVGIIGVIYLKKALLPSPPEIPN